MLAYPAGQGEVNVCSGSWTAVGTSIRKKPARTGREQVSSSLRAHVGLSLKKGVRPWKAIISLLHPKASRSLPWTKVKRVGIKLPLRPSRARSIRTKLQMADRKRDLAGFNLAIDSNLGSCDVVALRVEDVASRGCAMDRATIRQKKAGRPGWFELADQTRLAVDAYLWLTGRSRRSSCLPVGAEHHGLRAP